MIDAQRIQQAMASGAPPSTWADGPVRIPVRVEGDEFVAVVPPRETKTVAKVFGARFVDGEWRMPARQAQLWQLARLFQGRTDATPEVHRAADAWAAHAEYQEDIRLSGGYEPVRGLMTHQAQAADFLFNVGSGLLADEMGLGKTITAIEWLKNQHLTEPGLSLVATTLSMQKTWELELAKWWPEATVVRLVGDVGKRRKQIAAADYVADDVPVVLVLNHAQLPLHSRQQPLPGRKLAEGKAKPKELNALCFVGMVIDEAHKLRGYDTAFRMAAMQLGTQASNRLALTGTPKERSDDDLWAIMSWADPDNWGTRDEYRTMYCSMADAGWSKENQGIKPGLRPEVDRLLMPNYLRRTKDILPGLPEKMPMQWRIIELSKPQREVYEALVEHYGVVINGEVLTEANAATLCNRLGQTAAAMPVVTDGEVTSLGLPSTKIDTLLDIIDEGGDDPLVIYTESRKFAELIEAVLGEKHGIPTGLITGKVTAARRAKVIEQFQSGKLQVVVGTIGAGAEGVTLHRANRIVLAQMHWLAGPNDQAIDRVHRIGQSRGVQPIAIVAAGTVDVHKAMVYLGRAADQQSLLRDPGRYEAILRGTYDLGLAIKEANR